MKNLLLLTSFLFTTLNFAFAQCDSLITEFTYADTMINCDFRVEFSDQSTSSLSDPIVRYEWDFGDGTRNSLIQNPAHSYTQGGWMRIKLKFKPILDV